MKQKHIEILAEKNHEEFTFYQTELGDYAIVYGINTNKETPIACELSQSRAFLACAHLNRIFKSNALAAMAELQKEIDELKGELTQHKFIDDMPCYCDNPKCGKRFYIDLLLPAYIWKQIAANVRKRHAENPKIELLCPKCIGEEIEFIFYERRQHIVFRLTPINIHEQH